LWFTPSDPCCSIFIFLVMLCQTLFVFLLFVIWPFYSNTSLLLFVVFLCLWFLFIVIVSCLYHVFIRQYLFILIRLPCLVFEHIISHIISLKISKT
jgi:hypothetical protein